MAVINLSNGSRIRTFSPPPDGVAFDPLTASAADLRFMAFPGARKLRNSLRFSNATTLE